MLNYIYYMKKVVKKHEMCPVCKTVSLKPMYYKMMINHKLWWMQKDILVCPTEYCTVIATHTNNRILYLAPLPNSDPKSASNLDAVLRIQNYPLT